MGNAQRGIVIFGLYVSDIKEIKHTTCFRCKPRCRLELEVEDNQIVKVSASPIKKCRRKWAPDLEQSYYMDSISLTSPVFGERVCFL